MIPNVARSSAAVAAVAVLVAGPVVAAAAQVGGKPVIGGNPTPGTSQPEPPSVANRIGLTGCLQPVPGAAPAADDNTPTSSRFVLTGAARAMPAAAGQSGPAAASATYRLEGLDSLFSPFVGTRVEISGEPRESKAPGDPPTLVVEVVRKTASSCR